MKRDNKKQMLQIAAILLIGSISVVFYFFPDLIGGNKYSYKEIYKTREEINGLKSEISSVESQIENAKSEMENEILELEESIFNKNSILIDTYDYQLDIPSLLISLEQNAIKNGVEVEIEYNSIVYDFDGENTPNEQEGDSNEYQDETEDVNLNENTGESSEGVSEESLEESLEEVPEDFSEDESEFTEETEESFIDESQDFSESDSGVRRAYIPLKIKGTYSGARSYIKYLDEVGMLEPDNIKITSKQDYIEAEIGIIVFHGRID